jgi:hypothetical protein
MKQRMAGLKEVFRSGYWLVAAASTAFRTRISSAPMTVSTSPP